MVRARSREVFAFRDSRALPKAFPSQLITDPLSKALDKLGHDALSNLFTHCVYRLVSHLVVHHQCIAKLVESSRIFGAADRRIVFQDTRKHAGVEDAYLADDSKPCNLAVDFVKVSCPKRAA